MNLASSAGVVLAPFEASGPEAFVFLDPPYRHAATLGSELVDGVAAVLVPGGLVVGESDRREPLDLSPLTLDDERRYGDTLIRLYAS